MKGSQELRRTIDAIAESIVVLSPEGRTLDANAFLLDYTGLTLEEVRADESRVRRFHPDDVARLQEERRMALLRGEPFEAEHMLLQSETLRPMLKTWSPMSLGSWGLLLFGSFAFISFLGALADDGRGRRPRLAMLRPPGFLGVLIVVIGGLLGFFLAGYTGVLLTVTNRPIWADTSWLGVLFLVSGASTAAALLALVGRRRARANVTGLHALERFDSLMLVLELVALVALVISLGGMACMWLSAWGALLVVGVVGLGIVAPLVLYRRSLRLGVPSGAAASVLVLLGGFLLRVVIVLSSEGI